MEVSKVPPADVATRVRSFADDHRVLPRPDRAGDPSQRSHRGHGTRLRGVLEWRGGDTARGPAGLRESAGRMSHPGWLLLAGVHFHHQEFHPPLGETGAPAFREETGWCGFLQLD